MALNQIWISANGTDTASGTTFALAKKTLAGGITQLTTNALSNNNVLNIVNDGVHTMLNTTDWQGAGQINVTEGFSGTSYSGTAFGFLIQGVDSSGSPALVTVAATVSDFYGMITLRGGVSTPMKYGTIKGFKFDFTAVATKTDAIEGVRVFGTGCVPIRMLDCEVIGSSYGGTTPHGERNLLENFDNSYSTPTIGVELGYNVFTNASGSMRGTEQATQPWNLHHNIHIWATDNTSDTVAFAIISGDFLPYEDYTANHNTFVVITDYTAAGVNKLVSMVTTNATNVDIHSNLFHVQPASDRVVTAPFADPLVESGSGFNGTKGQHGYNHFSLGTNTSQLTSWTSGGFYEDTFVHPDFPTITSGTYTTTYSTDTVLTNAAIEDTFNTSSGTWAWEDAGDNGYSHTLPFDMRPVVSRTGGLDGSVVGAIAADIIIPVPPGVGDSIEYPAVLDSLPFYRPTFKADAIAMVRVQRNRTYAHINLRHYVKEERFDESVHRIVVVAAAARYAGSLAGVAAASLFLLETDTTVNVTLTWNNGTTDVDFGLTVGSALTIDQAGIKSVVINNTSSTTATVQFVAFQ